jgi:hypothetical protein
MAFCAAAVIGQSFMHDHLPSVLFFVARLSVQALRT